jgi:Zn finger protein HypA/HybF involved in hydrogenase expression
MDSWPTTPETLKAVYDAYVSQHGKSRATSEMARAFAISPYIARRRLMAAGLRTVRKPVERPTESELRASYKELAAEHGERWAIGQLAKRHGVVYMTARQWLIEAGLHSVTPQPEQRPITEPCPCGEPATTRYKNQDPALCFKCYMRTYAADKNSKFRRTARVYIAEVKRNATCADCGGKYPPCVYHFDHVPGRGEKRFNLGSGDYSLKAVQDEIAKCDIVCANCHAIRTWVSRGKSVEDAD